MKMQESNITDPVRYDEMKHDLTMNSDIDLWAKWPYSQS